ncbi:MAG: ABC transporter substrate-binding protein [Thermodesulfovibrionales bacterium]|nr:ABC transporter substrate-binding protein [Thermodesulfovibrionales bacterium]
MKIKKTQIKATLLAVVTLLLFPIFVYGADRTPIKIGFIGGLTGRSSDLGIQGRNGAMLAVEEINQMGGINGRTIQLLIRDDKQDQQTAIKEVQGLLDEGVIAIIGHMTSSMSEVTLPLLNERKIPIISPTASTNKLTGIDDYFLRVINPNIQLTRLMADNAYRKLRLRKMVAVYDLSNRTYSEGYINEFKTFFEGQGGKIISTYTFNTGSNVSYKKLVRDILQRSPDGLIIATGALDAAMICQHVRMAGSKIPILSSGWAQTPDFIRHGGTAVEGVFFTAYVDYDSTEKPFVEFKERFKARFGQNEPTFAAVFAYESVMVIRDALMRNIDTKQLKETILKQKVFRGLQGTFEIDTYGDAIRKAYIVVVNKGRFSIKER